MSNSNFSVYFQAKRLANDNWQEAIRRLENLDLKHMDFLKSEQELTPNATLEEVLKHAYETVQRWAVGIEQVTLDQALYESNSLENFRKIEGDIVMILCELNFAMVRKNIQFVNNVPKSIMHDDLKNTKGTSAREIRDLYILNAYLQGLRDLDGIFKNFS